MLRRDFFKAISAAAAAIAAAPAAIAASKTPTVAVSANASRFAAGIRKAKASLPPPTPAPDDTLAFVRSILKECRVVGHEMSMSVGELMRCRVTYRHDPNGRQTKEDREWEDYLADAKIISVNVSTGYENIDISHLGEGPFGSLGSMYKPVSDVEIEYIVVPKRSST